MTIRRQKVYPQLGPAAVQIFATNERINQLLIQHLNPTTWSAKLPANSSAQVRTIAAIFTHIHNVRAKWIRLSAPHLKVPAQLNRSRCTPHQAGEALSESAARCEEMIAEALSGTSGRVKNFVRDGWAQPWPTGPEMLCYMISHEAHHRGQVCMLAHQLGHPLPKALGASMWNWEKLWKETGAPPGNATRC